MHRRQVKRPMQNHVMAVFEASALAFELPHDASLEVLADYLAKLSERRREALISVELRVSTKHLLLGELEGGHFERKRPVIAQKPATLVEHDGSPYLQRPLRSFERAQQDSERQGRQPADAVTEVPIIASYRLEVAPLTS